VVRRLSKDALSDESRRSKVQLLEFVRCDSEPAAASTRSSSQTVASVL